MPLPEIEKYSLDKHDKHYKQEYLRISQEEVEKNFSLYNLLDENVIFVKGFFEYSLPGLNIETIAVLRIDCDMYSSTTQVLDSLYDKVANEGFIILDDFARRSRSYHAKETAIDFRSKRNITDPLIRTDDESAYWQKKERKI